MPFETTRRHVARLLRDQLCVRARRTGLLVPDDVVRKGPVSQIKSLTALRLLQLFSALGAAGFSLPVSCGQSALQAGGQDERLPERQSTP